VLDIKELIWNFINVFWYD